MFHGGGSLVRLEFDVCVKLYTKTITNAAAGTINYTTDDSDTGTIYIKTIKYGV